MDEGIIYVAIIMVRFADVQNFNLLAGQDIFHELQESTIKQHMTAILQILQNLHNVICL